MKRIQADVGSITPELVTNLVRLHREKIRPDIIKMQNYALGDNEGIRASKNYSKQDQRVIVPTGKNLVENTVNYLFSQKPDYNCEDEKFKKEVLEIQAANSDQETTKMLGFDMLSVGEAYKLFYDEGQFTPAYDRIDPAECFAVYDYQIRPEMIFFVRYYIKQRLPENALGLGVKCKLYVEVYTDGEVIKYESRGESPGINTLFIEIFRPNTPMSGLVQTSRTAHFFGRVPVVHYIAETYQGILWSVVSLMDAIDITATQLCTEVLAYQLCMLLNTGAKFDSESVVKIKEGRVTILNIAPTDKGGAGSLQYLTKDVDYNGVLSVLNWYIDTVHDVSGIPNFNKKDFSAATGIALAYKLIGFDNISESVGSMFTAGERTAIGLMAALQEFGRSRRFDIFKILDYFKKQPDKSITVKVRVNIPLDMQSEISKAEGLKRIGFDMESILKTLPDELVPDVQAALERITKASEEAVKKQQEMFKTQGSPDKATPPEGQPDLKTEKIGAQE